MGTEAVRSKSRRIRDLCTREVTTVAADTAITDCARTMHDAHVGSLVVVRRHDSRTEPIGILTDRDITIEVVAFGLDPGALRASDVMSKPLATARLDEDLMPVLARMREHGVRRMPVVDSHGALVGILSAEDVLRTLAEEVSGLVSVGSAERTREAMTRSSTAGTEAG